MGLIHLDAVQPGMVLAADVIAAPDRLLLGAGLALTDKHLRILRLWGISEVEVAGDAEGGGGADGDGEMDPARVDAIRRHVDELFRLVDPADPVAAELRRLVTLRLARGAGGSEPGAPDGD